MNSKTLVRKFKQEYYGTAKVKELADDWGVRIRQTPECKDNEFEVSGAYFYETQEETPRIFDALHSYAKTHGYTVEQIRGVRFHRAANPQRLSWASIIVAIS